MTGPKTINPHALMVYHSCSVRWLEGYVLSCFAVFTAAKGPGEREKLQASIEKEIREWALKFWEISPQEADRLAAELIGVAMVEIMSGNPQVELIKAMAERIAKQGWTPAGLMQLDMAAAHGT